MVNTHIITVIIDFLSDYLDLQRSAMTELLEYRDYE